ncbi:phage tail terminator family protein [Brevibacillus borstelensis]|uniref:phage tail terminator family protein n=1 Tax=Brevibacillus borstelensis TaxID=45462 RepID=UPI0030C5C740
MQPVTFLDVRTGVFKALETAFPGADRYGEEIKEGLTTPSFFVKLLEPTHTQELDRRYVRELPFDVHYFADSNKDRITTAEQLTSVLGTIQVNSRPVCGIKMSWEIIDEVLHFFVTYRMQVWKQKPDVPSMQTLDIEEAIKI